MALLVSLLVSAASAPTGLLAQSGEGPAIETLGSLSRAQPALHLRLAEGRELALVASHSQGIRIVDVSDPAVPTLLATADTEGEAYEAKLLGDRLYAATWSGGLEVFDLSDPSQPTRLGGIGTASNAVALAVAGETAFVGSWSAENFEGGDPDYGIEAFDVSDPASPSLISRLDTPGWAGEILLHQQQLYVADGPAGLRVIDVSNPAAMLEIGAVQTTVRAYGLDVDAAANRIYVADNAGGLQIVDIEDPSEPEVLGGLQTAGAAYGVAADGDRVWMTESLGGGPDSTGVVHLIDVSDPTAPSQIASLDTQGRAWAVDLDSVGRAHVAATSQGMLILDAAADMRIYLPRLMAQDSR